MPRPPGRRRRRPGALPRAQRLLLPGVLQLGHCDLLHLVRSTSASRARSARRHPARPVRRRAPGAGSAARTAQVGAGERVEHVALGRRGHQGAVLVLAVDLGQPAAVSARARSDAIRPSIQARERPSAGTERARMTSRSVAVGPSPSPPTAFRRRNGLPPVPRSRPPAPCRRPPAHRGRAGAPRPPGSCRRRSRPSAPSCPGRRRASGPRSPRGHGPVARSARRLTACRGGRSASRRKRRMPPKVCGSLRTTRTGCAACDRSPPSRAEAGPRSPVDDQRPRPVGHDLDASPPGPREHEAAVEREVRGHRRHHHGSAGSEPGSARRRTGCRPSSRSGWPR